MADCDRCGVSASCPRAILRLCSVLVTVPADALRLIAADPPDVVVLDLGLPDLDGKDVIARVRAWSDVPIVVLSAREREGEKIAALELGADDFVNKPFALANSWPAFERPCATGCSAQARRRSCGSAGLRSTLLAVV
jgi:CheY-like chemotaxis protein